MELAKGSVRAVSFVREPVCNIAVEAAGSKLV